MIRARLCARGKSPNGIDKEGCTIPMGAVPKESLCAIERCALHCTNIAISRPILAICCVTMDASQFAVVGSSDVGLW